MSNISDLYKKKKFLLKEIDNHKISFCKEKKKILSIESLIIENRELLRSLNEQIRLYELENDFSSLIDENREKEIVAFKESYRLGYKVISEGQK